MKDIQELEGKKFQKRSNKQKVSISKKQLIEYSKQDVKNYLICTNGKNTARTTKNYL